MISVGVGVVMAMSGLAPAQAFEELDAKVSLPPMAKPAAKPVGYKWISLKNGEDDYILTKIAEKGGLETWKQIDGCSFTRPAGEHFAMEVKWTSCGGLDGTQDVKLNGSAWPLQVGKTWSQDYSGINHGGRTWSSTNKCTVEAQVRVKVKAGEFDTYKVVCKDTWNTRTHYISPELGSSVYYVREHSSRGGKYELVKQEFPNQLEQKVLLAKVERLKREAEEVRKAAEAHKAREAEAEKAREAEIARLRQEVEERRKVQARLTDNESRELDAREAEMARLRREAEEARRAVEVRKAREAEEQKAREAEIARLKQETEQAVKAREVEIARLKKTLAERRDDKAGDAGPSFSGVDFGRYHALVIGIDNYKELPKLKTAISDARAVAEVLERDYGFSVTLLIDPDAREIVDKLDVYRETLGPKDNLLIYYAGHGWLDKEADRGYWLPVDAKPKRRSGWVSNATVSDTLKTLSAKHVMVVADSCYSGTLVRSADVGTRTRTGDYWKRMAAKWARVAITSGGVEPVADSSGGGHSPFAKAFIDGLRANAAVIDGTSLFSQMRRPVMVAAQQTPQYADVREAGHDGGDFLFVRKK